MRLRTWSATHIRKAPLRLPPLPQVILALGGLANGLYFPERFFPGKLDYFINGHQAGRPRTVHSEHTVHFGCTVLPAQRAL